MGDHLNRVRETEHLIAVRALLALGRAEEAFMLAVYVVKTAEEAERWRAVVEASLLTAQALAAQGQAAQACTWLQRALAVAEPQGYVRTFVDEGRVMYEMLAQCRGKNEEARLREYRTQLMAAFGEHRVGNAVRPAQPSGLVEPLSVRELELLQLVAAGYSNQEIADELVITLGTVKSHLNHIFAKLGVEGRVRAVNRARELALIEQQ